MNSADVVVVGSGVAGLTAALTAANSGLSVVVIEKTDLIGGSTAWAAGGAFLPGCDHLPPEEDGAALRYLDFCTDGKMNRAMVETYLNTGPEALRHLESISEVRFDAYPGLDYRSEAPGARGSRTVMPKPFDASVLGDSLRTIRPPLPDMTVFGGMQVDYADIAQLLKATRSPKSMVYAARMMLRHFIGKLRYGRSPRLVFGNSLVGRLFKSVLDRSNLIDVRLNCDAIELRVESNRVTGVVCRQGGKSFDLNAKTGVLLATGGFPGNTNMRSEHTSYADQHLSMPPPSNVGGGIKMALAIGARLTDEVISNYCYTPVSRRVTGDGKEHRFPHFAFDGCYPGAIAVGSDGRRFANEGIVYSDFVPAMHAAGAVPAYLICDRKFLRKYGLGMVRPSPFPIGSFIKQGYLTEAPTIDALAHKLGVEAEGLLDSVKRNNAYAETGKDLDFGKGDDAYTRSRGDPSHGPNPTIGPIGHAPFYAIALYPGDTATTRGLIVDTKARVLDREGQPIAGLYAAGPDMANPTMGVNSSGGFNIGPGLTFGYIAATDMAAAETL